MDNSRTPISSSIVSLIIVTVGMFLLCMGRPPQINTGDSPLGNSGEESGIFGDEDQALLTLLDEAGDDLNLEDDAELLADVEEKSDSEQAGANMESTADDDLAGLLSEGDDLFGSEQTEEESDDEILRLLEMDKEVNDVEEQRLEKTREYSETEFSESTTENYQAQTQEAQPVDNLLDEVNKLEQTLSAKASEKEKLLSELAQYDRRIAELEAQLSGAGAYQSSIQQASYYEDAPMKAVSKSPEYGSLDIGGDFDVAYDNALQLFNSHQYRQAKDQFFQLLQLYPRHRLADNCRYWIGECYYAQGKYYQAIVEFTKVYAYEAKDKIDDAQLMTGLAFMKLGEFGQAEAELNWLVNTYTASEYVNKAYRYLSQL